MTKDIKQIQEYNRRKILCALYNTDDYDEALLRERDKNAGLISFCNNCRQFIQIGNALDNFIEFKGNNITLDRVLLSLDKADKTKIYNNFDKLLICSSGEFMFSFKDDFNHLNYESLDFKWNLTKLTLEGQDYETQLAIYKLLGGE